MISINYVVVFLSIIFYIGCSYGIKIENKNNILYDNQDSYVKSFKAGDIFEFKHYTQIKEKTIEQCTKLYGGRLVKNNGIEVSDVDYFYSEDKDSIKVIIPKVNPGNDYLIAIKISQKQDIYLYTNPFEIVEGGKTVIANGVDGCGVVRVTSFNYYNQNDIVEEVQMTKTKVNEYENFYKVLGSESNSNIDPSLKYNNENPPKSIDQNLNITRSHTQQVSTESNNLSESFTNNMEPQDKIQNETSISQPASPDNQKSNLSTKHHSIYYILVFLMGVLFCALIVGSLFLVNKRRKDNKGVIINSFYSENPNESLSSPKFPSDYGYNSPITRIQSQNLNNNICTLNNDCSFINNSLKKSNTTNSEQHITKNNSILSNTRSYSLNHGYCNNYNTNLNTSPVPLLTDNGFAITNEVSFPVVTQNYTTAPTAAVNILEPIETPSTEIKFVATSSYEPKNKNEIKISSLDIVYIVGYVDEQYAQILNITTNNYGIIPISELNKIQP